MLIRERGGKEEREERKERKMIKKATHEVTLQGVLTKGDLCDSDGPGSLTITPSSSSRTL